MRFQSIFRAAVSLALAAAALPIASAEAQVRKFPASAVKEKAVVFKVKGVNPRAVVRVSFVVHRRSHHRTFRRTLGLRRARHQIRHGRLRVDARVPARPTKRSKRRPTVIVKMARRSAPKPPASPCSNPIAPGAWPVGCWRPYSDASPFNRPLPPNPRLASDSAAIVSRLASWGKPQGLIVGHPDGSNSDYGHATYYASAEDPLYTIHCTKWTASCPIEGMQLHVPAAARAASGTDSHMVVIDQAANWEYDFWQVHTQPLPPAGGVINVSHGGRTRWGTEGADGLGSNATAAQFGLSAGVIRAEEWEAAVASGTAINHALFMSVKCSGGYSVYPAAPGTTAAPCSSFGSSNEGAPPMGAHFYLDMSDAQIDVLAVPAWRKPILKAMARYGLFVGDTFANGPNSFGLAAESDAQYRAMGQPGHYAALGKKWGVGTYDGAYLFDIDTGVDWARYLKVVDPCVAQGSC